MPADPQASTSGSSPTMSHRKAVLNIPEGNQSIIEAHELDPAEERSGDAKKDYLEALKRVNPTEDIRNIGQIPCARQALLTGIAGGTGFGAVMFLSRRRPWQAGNWAVLTFIGLSGFMWESCRRKRTKELSQMMLIQEKFASRHVSHLKKKEPAVAPNRVDATTI